MVEAIMFIAGALIGFVVSIAMTKKPVGSLFFYDSEPGEPPVMAAELHQPIENIRDCTHVVFTVSRR